jgi:UDP-N-acetyl-2-amino-2-deoxyglucuronate dehydrogenase
MSYNFALIGAAGFIAPRHMKAIHDTGNRLVAATDPHDAVGVLDSYALDTRFFPEIERFDRHLEKLRREDKEHRDHLVSICSPNYLHDAHVRMALRIGADAICEKPIVINPWNLDALESMEMETGKKVYTVLQLRLHPSLMKLRERLRSQTSLRKHNVILTYITGRGAWYQTSWKGVEEKSGGVATNIGIHFFDLLISLFGDPECIEVHYKDPRKMSGFLELQNASVRWFLSVDPSNLPQAPEPGKRSTFRSIVVDDHEIEFTEGFSDLHTRVYEATLAGNGFGIADARPSINLVHAIRTKPVTMVSEHQHPFLTKLLSGERSIGIF